MTITPRSVALIGFAAGCITVAFVAGVPGLLYPAGLAAGLVAIAAVAGLLTHPRLDAVRSVDPPVADPGEAVTVAVTVTLRSRFPVVAGTWRDRVGSGLTAAARGDLPPLRQGRSFTVRYEVVGRRRGGHDLGPLTVVVGDAFGLTSRLVRVPGHDRVVVLPSRTPLEEGAGLGPIDEGVSRALRSTGLGHDDVIARRYLPGDALKRWHWKATAHRGEPMVRQEEVESRPVVQVLLDTDPRTQDASGFEWGVSAAASIVTHHAERGFDVELVAGAADLVLESGHGLQDALVLLALVETSSVVPVLAHQDRTTFVVTGRLSAESAGRLAAAVGSRDVVVIASAFTDDAQDACAAAGWRVVLRGPAEDVASVWTRAGAVVAS